MADKAIDPWIANHGSGLRAVTRVMQSLGWGLVGGVLLAQQAAEATTAAGPLFCQKYPAALGCESEAATCAICHAGPPALNFYGVDLKASLTGPLAQTLIAALDKIEPADSDGDGFNNVDEIMNASAPGNPQVMPASDVATVYDVKVAYKRMKAVYCGQIGRAHV